VIGVVALATVSFLVGRQMASPAQVAAQARPPTPSVPTVAVRAGVLKTTVTFRATIGETATVAVTAPTSVGADRPVVTGLSVAAGDQVADGQVVMSVAERPVFVLAGAIPAFRTMSHGTRGVDVQQLQAALAQLGLYDGDDPPGFFGPHTRSAVHTLYQRAGFTLEDGAVPLGEILFVRSLPQRVLAVHTRLGAELPQAVSNDSSSSGAVTLGSGHVVVKGSIDSVSASGLKAGMSGVAHAELSGKSFPVKVRSITRSSAPAANSAQQQAVVLTPTRHIPETLLGQNVGVTITPRTTGRRVLIVPIAAVTTRADGTSYLTVVTGSAASTVAVRPGLVADGEIAVMPVDAGKLAAGDRVAVGQVGA
jgi:peptidoglycan hydrolase-like protein with peptidoglycan-binding domain